MRRMGTVTGFGIFLGGFGGNAKADGGSWVERRRKLSRWRSMSRGTAAILDWGSPQDGRLRDVVVEDAKLLPKEVVEHLKRHFLSRTFPSEEEMQSGASWLEQWYAQNEYTMNEVLLSQTPSSSNGWRLVYQARERTLGGIKFKHHRPKGGSAEGSGRTQERLIFHALGLVKGEPFKMSQQRFEALHRLQLFDDVIMRPDKLEKDAVSLEVELFEKPSLEIVPAFGVNMRTGPVGSVKFEDRNFRGLGHSLSITGSRSVAQGLEGEFSFVNRRLDSPPGSTRYSWSLRTTSRNASSRAPGQTSGLRVWTSTPLDKLESLAFQLDGSVEHQHTPAAVSTVADRERANRVENLASSSNQLEGTLRLVNEHRRGDEVREGHREEIAYTRGVNLDWEDGDMEVNNSYMRAVGKAAGFLAVLQQRVGLVLGAEVHGSGSHAPGISQGMWYDGELRGVRRLTFPSGSIWAKTIGEVRVPVHSSVTAFAFSEYARAVPTFGNYSVGTVGIGLRLVRTVSVILSTDSRGMWRWSLLPVERDL